MYNTRFLYLFFILVTVHSVCTAYHQDTEKQDPKQPISLNFPDYFFTPLHYSEQSLTFFLKKIYNDRRYPHYFLSNNFAHVIDGINFAPNSSLPRLTIQKILALFRTKLDNIYVNPYAFSQLLAEIYPTVARYCNKYKEKLDTIETIKECIGAYLIDNYASFKQNPEKALEDLSETLYAITNEPLEDQDIPIRELQHAVYQFLDKGLSKLIWNPADQIDTWINVKLLSCQLERFTEYYIIDTKMFNSLLWTLLNRYSYFISLVAKELKQDFFDTVRADLQSERAALWDCEEQENYITTKLEHLTTTLLEAEIAAQIDAVSPTR